MAAMPIDPTGGWLSAGSAVLSAAAGAPKNISSRSGDIVTPVSLQAPFDSSGWNVNIRGLGVQSGGASGWLTWAAIGLIAWKLWR